MDSLGRHRCFALLFMFFFVGVVFAMPALADSDPMQAIVDDYASGGDAKLVWLEKQMEPPSTETQQLQAYESATRWIARNADAALEQLIKTAGTDPVRLAQIPKLAEEIAELEQQFLESAEEIYNDYVPPVTTTITLPPVTTTTLVKLPLVTSTTLPIATTTSTTASSSTSTSSTSTTSTTLAKVTTTTRPSNAVGSIPPTTTRVGSPTGGSGGDVVTAGTPAAVAAATNANASNVLSASVDAAIPRSPFLFNVEPSEVVSVQQMLAPYRPADLPSRLPAPVTSLLAVLQLILGAFISSFRQIGGPAAAGTLYLVYAVWRYLRSKAPGSLPA